MGKKAALTTEQQQQYDAVMQQLQASGALKGSGTEPATKRAKTSPEASETVAKTSKTKEPSVAEKAAKTMAARGGSKATTTKEAAPAAAEAAQTAAPVPKAKGKSKAKAKPSPKAKAKSVESTADANSGADAGGPEFFDDEVGVLISWKNFPEVCAKVRALRPEETQVTVYEAMTEALGACPPALQPAGLFPLAAADEQHPGPVLEDPSLKEGEDRDEDEASVEQDAAVATDEEDPGEEDKPADEVPAPATVNPDEAETQVTLEPAEAMLRMLC